MAPANYAFDGPVEGLLYEAQSTCVGMVAQARPITVARERRRAESRLRDITSTEQ